MVRSYSEIQKRRKKRLSEQKKKTFSYYGSRSTYSSGRPTYHSFEEVDTKLQQRLIRNITMSVILLFTVYIIFQTNHPYAKVTQQFIQESLTKEYNFKGLYSWYQKKFQGFPAIIPAFHIKEREGYEPSYSFISPIAHIPEDIMQADSGIYLKTEDNEGVRVINQGLVIEVKELDYLGKTIVIRHQNGIESTYAMLNTVEVEKNEWVEEGKVLGNVQHMLYFAMKKNNQYIDPLEVISFENIH